MTPEIGKWYLIKYGKPTSKRAYHGPALCIGKDDHFTYHPQEYFFIAPEHIDKIKNKKKINPNPLFPWVMIFRSHDIKKTLEPTPKFEKALLIVQHTEQQLKENIEKLRECFTNFYKTQWTD